MKKEAAISCIRQSLTPTGYIPHTFRRNTPESYLDMLRSIVATYLYRDQIGQLKKENVDFSKFLYVPEIDVIMGGLQGMNVVTTTTYSGELPKVFQKERIIALTTKLLMKFFLTPKVVLLMLL